MDKTEKFTEALKDSGYFKVAASYFDYSNISKDFGLVRLHYQNMIALKTFYIYKKIKVEEMTLVFDCVFKGYTTYSEDLTCPEELLLGILDCLREIIHESIIEHVCSTKLLSMLAEKYLADCNTTPTTVIKLCLNILLELDSFSEAAFQNFKNSGIVESLPKVLECEDSDVKFKALVFIGMITGAGEQSRIALIFENSELFKKIFELASSDEDEVKFHSLLTFLG